jgi:hypothetical protein
LNAEPIYPKLPRVAVASALSLATLAVVVVATTPVADADMRAATDRLRAEVAAVRRLPASGTLDRRVETRDEARRRRGAELAAVAADPELAARARLWQGLGLVPPGTDARSVAAAFDAAPTASYDPLTRRLFVPDWIPLPDQRPALAHALAHALADARFGLRGVLGLDLEGRHHLDGDAERARLALVEGDAALTALELDDPRGALTGSHALTSLVAAMRAAPAASGAPDWLSVNASFAHADGLAFVGRVRSRQPWSAVDALWAEPPRSSEQILHPEKYDAREAPLLLAPPKPRALAGAWREASSDVLGELGVRTWLAAAVPEPIAARAATGWGGDRAVLFEPAEVAPDGGVAGASFVVWWTAWDDVTEADDFAAQATTALRALAGADAAPAEAPIVARRGDAVFALARRADTVALLIGGPAAAVPALDQGLTALKAGRRPVAPAGPKAHVR